MGAITFAMPRKPAATSRISVPGIIPFFFSLIALILIILILAAGSNSGVLDELSFLSVDVSTLNISSKLSSSRFLQDLSIVSGADYVGQPLTASALGLANYYTITTLGSCAHGTSTTCTTPHVGYVFDPRYDLKLEQTSASSQFTPELSNAVSAYHRSAAFLGLAYIMSLILVVLAPILSAFPSHFCSVGFLGATVSCFASLILIAVSVLSEVGALKQLNTAINDSYGNIGVQSSIGELSIFSWVATACSIVATVFYFFRASRPPIDPYGYSGQARGEVVVGDGLSPIKLGFWGKAPTVSNHRYVQVEKQPAVVQVTGVPSHEETIVVDSTTSDEYYTPGQRKSIPMMNLGKGGRKNLHTAYEPNRRRA